MRARTVLVSLALVVAAGGGAAAGVALSDGDDDDDPPATTTSAAVDGSSTSAPPTTRAAGRTTVVAGPDGVLGWWDGTTWVQASPDGASAVPLTGGEELDVLLLDAPATKARAGRVGAAEEFCGVPRLPLTPELERSGAIAAPIAVHGVADPRPRPLTQLDREAAVYREAARVALSAEGIDDPAPELAQIVRADLSGDGSDEILIVAERLAQPESLLSEPGDYSVLLLRQVVDGDVRTTVVHRSVNESTPESPSPYLVAARVSAVADLNGDGAMEVVTSSRYYEGGATQVYEARPGGGLQEVLSGGCGV